MAFKAPSGLMVYPEEPERFSQFELVENAGDTPYGMLFMAREIWETLDPGTQELVFYIQNYGRYRLAIHTEK